MIIMLRGMIILLSSEPLTFSFAQLAKGKHSQYRVLD